MGTTSRAASAAAEDTTVRGTPRRNRQHADPEHVSRVRAEAGRKGGAARASLDHYVRQVVARAPELTPEQRAKIAAAFATPGGSAA